MDDRPGRGAAVGRDTPPAVSRGNRNQRLLIVGAVVLAAGLMIRIFASRQHGERVSAAGGAEVYYRAPVTRETATRLARFLEAKGVFSKTGGKKTAQLLRQGTAYTLRVVVRGDAKTLPDADVRGLRMMAGVVAHQVLGGAEVTLQLCDRALKPQRTVAVPRSLGDLGSRLTFARGELYYRAPIAVEQAKRVGALLLARGFFSAQGRSTVQLVPTAGKVQVRFVVSRDKVQKKPEVIAGFRALVAEIGQAAFGKRRALLELCDPSFDCFVTDR